MLTDWIDVCDVIDEISFPQVNGYLSVRRTFLKNPTEKKKKLFSKAWGRFRSSKDFDTREFFSPSPRTMTETILLI